VAEVVKAALTQEHTVKVSQADGAVVLVMIPEFSVLWQIVTDHDLSYLILCVYLYVRFLLWPILWNK